MEKNRYYTIFKNFIISFLHQKNDNFEDQYVLIYIKPI